jgi:hypothetical protein
MKKKKFKPKYFKKIMKCVFYCINNMLALEKPPHMTALFGSVKQIQVRS